MLETTTEFCARTGFPHKTINSMVIYKNPWFKVRHDRVHTPKFQMKDFYVVEKGQSVFIIPLDENKKINMVKLFRHNINRWTLEIPAGAVDEGEDILKAAERELQEETGLISDLWTKISTFHIASGITNNVANLFIASNLKQTNINEQEEEGIVEVVQLTIDEIIEKISFGEIMDGPTITSIFLYKELGIV